MKRGKTERKEGTLRWKKEGGGSLRFDGRIIKPGEKFWAHPDDIPEAFKNTLTCITEGQTGQSLPDTGNAVDKEEVTEVVYSIKLNKKLSSSEEELYDVVDAKGKVISESTKPVGKEEAEANCVALNVV